VIKSLNAVFYCGIVALQHELFALSRRKGSKQAPKERQYVSILYLNFGKQTIEIKQQTTFLELS